MSQAGVTFGSGWMLAMRMGSRDSDRSRATRMAGPYVSITTMTPSRPAFSNSRISRSASSRYLIGLLGMKSATPARCAAISAAYPRLPLGDPPGSLSS